mgnify:CR=1 FL=1
MELLCPLKQAIKFQDDLSMSGTTYSPWILPPVAEMKEPSEDQERRRLMDMPIDCLKYELICVASVIFLKFWTLQIFTLFSSLDWLARNLPKGSKVRPFAFESRIFSGAPSLMFMMQILESVPQVAKCRLSGAHVRSVMPRKGMIIDKNLIVLTLMIPPDFLCLPVFSHFNFVMIRIGLLVLEILLVKDWHRISAPVCVVEDVLALRHKLMSLELPQDRSSVVTTAREKGTNTVPSDTIDWLFMVSQLRQFTHRFDLFFFKQTLHGGNIWSKGFTHWVIIIEFLTCVLDKIIIKLNSPNN